jgi:hypothetical protein
MPVKTVKTMTFMQACGDYFGKKIGQTLTQFRDELKALTEKDREELIAGLEQQGYKITTLGAPLKAPNMAESLAAQPA